MANPRHSLMEFECPYNLKDMVMVIAIILMMRKNLLISSYLEAVIIIKLKTNNGLINAST